jgi:glycosyltransferase involved in cell wall biosynthesis
MPQYSISIVIPALNEERNIGKCLDAVRLQMSQGDEIIVVDNGSTDGTVKIAEDYGVRVLHEVVRGQSHAVAKGFNDAKNQILARTDADTIVAEGLVAITGPTYLREFLPIKLGVHRGIAKKHVGHEVLVGGNEAVTSNLWSTVSNRMSNEDSLYAEDVEMSIRIVKSGGKIDFIQTMIVFTSARWMLIHPIRSYSQWRRKMRETLKLL